MLGKILLLPVKIIWWTIKIFLWLVLIILWFLTLPFFAFLKVIFRDITTPPMPGYKHRHYR